MVSRASVAPLLLALSTTIFIHAQASQPGDSAQATAAILGVVGKVLSSDGRPVPGIHVELNDARTAVPVTSTYTERDGSFELYNIPTGTYEVVAESDSSEVSDAVNLQQGRPSLELRFPRSTSPSSAPDPTVSVVQLRVPEKAQKLYRKAEQAFRRGNFDQAHALLDQALIIEPQFPDALALRGMIDIRDPDLSPAQRELEEAVRIDPSESAAYIALAAVYNHQGRFDDALLASERALTVAPNAWQGYLEMAKASIAKSMYQRGLQLIRQAERMGGSGIAEVHLVKAYALLPMKLYQAARYELRASLSREPKGKVAQQAQTMLAQLDQTEGAELASAK